MKLFSKSLLSKHGRLNRFQLNPREALLAPTGFCVMGLKRPLDTELGERSKVSFS